MSKHNYDLIRSGYLKRKRRWRTATILMALLVVVLCGAMLVFGNTYYSLSVVFRVLAGEEVQGAVFAIQTLRLPRMIGGVLAGFSFGIAGSTFQTMLRNPLASPDIIGVTSGASAAAVFCLLVLQISGNIVSVAAVGAGLATSLMIYLLAKGSGYSGGRLILIGIGVQAVLNAVVSTLLLKASEYDVPAAVRWLSGSLNGIQMNSLPALVIAVLIFVPVILGLGKHLRMLELGEQAAISLGVNVNQVRMLLIVCAVVLIAFATAVTGPISFVAFLAGPIAARIVGLGSSNQLPSGLTGALLVLGGDLMGQFAFSTKFPVGVITGILGAPYLLYLLVRMNRKGGS